MTTVQVYMEYTRTQSMTLETEVEVPDEIAEDDDAVFAWLEKNKTSWDGSPEAVIEDEDVELTSAHLT